MKEKDNHRTIKLDLDVAPIASELASKRILSKVLSELLRKEYGISFEEDLLKSKIQELERQSEAIKDQMNELNHTMNRKKEKELNEEMISNLEYEIANLSNNLKIELKSVIDLTVDELGIDQNKFKDHELMSEISKAKGRKRISITDTFKEREEQINKELLWRYVDRENYA